VSFARVAKAELLNRTAPRRKGGAFNCLIIRYLVCWYARIQGFRKAKFARIQGFANIEFARIQELIVNFERKIVGGFVSFCKINRGFILLFVIKVLRL
jgi:hypothetical protein